MTGLAEGGRVVASPRSGPSAFVSEGVGDDYEDGTPTNGREIVIYKSAWPFAAVTITLIICMTVMAALQGMGYITHKIG